MKHRSLLSLLLAAITFLVCTGCNDQMQPNALAKSVTSAASTALDKSIALDTSRTNRLTNGQKDGLWQTFHSNGLLKRKGHYVLGKKEGTHKEWSDTGILLVEEVFKDGKGNGLTQWFHDGGHLAGEGQMVDGVRQGPWKICDIEENGFCIDANFVDGKREGLWIIYHDKTQASVWKEQTFMDNQMVAEKCFDLEGEKVECE